MQVRNISKKFSFMKKKIDFRSRFHLRTRYCNNMLIWERYFTGVNVMLVRSMTTFSGRNHSIFSHLKSWRFESGVIHRKVSKEVERFVLQDSYPLLFGHLEKVLSKKKVWSKMMKEQTDFDKTRIRISFQVHLVCDNLRKATDCVRSPMDLIAPTSLLSDTWNNWPWTGSNCFNPGWKKPFSSCSHSTECRTVPR